MRITFSEVSKLLESKFQKFTLESFIDECGDEFEQSLTTAQLIEDYDFLAVMTRDNSRLDKKITVLCINSPHPTH